MYASPLNPALPRRPGERRYWGRLYGSSKALALSAAVEQNQGPLLVLTEDLNSARRLSAELDFYFQHRGRHEGRDKSAHAQLTFPDWETLPYDCFSPYQDIISDRLATLVELGRFSAGILVVAVSTSMHRLLPKDYLVANSLSLKKGQTLNIETFRRRMEQGGYRIVSQVMEHGEIAIRGSLVDIYPMGAAQPYRIDLFDDEIDSIRPFDAESQRSLAKIAEIRILPAREVALTEAAISRFRANWRSRFAGNANNCPLYREVSAGIAPAGIEYYLPLFYEQTQSLFDYLPENCTVALDEDVYAAAESFWDDIENRYEQGRHDLARPPLPPVDAFYAPAALFSRLQAFPQVRLSAMKQRQERAGTVNFSTRAALKLPIDARAKEPLGIVKRFLDEFQGRVLLVAESPGRRETMLQLLARHGLRPGLLDGWWAFLDSSQSLALTVAALEQGAVLDEPQLAVISEAQLFGERVQQRRLRRRRQQQTDAIVRNLSELNIGAAVVHEEHGVGRYHGLITLSIGDIEAEFIHLEYAQGDKLYVPVASLELISRYAGVDPEHAPLHRLGSGQWEKARRKAAAQVRDVAAELLELHARRAARPGTSMTVDEDSYHAFLQGFPFEETPGQADAINDVLEDLRSAKAMDRLICGDAGFGKTEVALRAAFITVQNHRQVALLVPTTLLAQQHYQNFKDRFADWPVRVEVLSRFVPRKEQEKIITDLNSARVDIVIGTHRLLQGDIRFSRLGLMIIDEEHRFGVRQKEQFKSMRAEVDVLTLTATPIPRTLNMALSELRELSIIATPPAKRLAVQTFVREWNEAVLKEALLREIKRGGQVYFLHNKVEDIEQQAKRVAALIPEARVQLAHGQLPERQLERVMLDFYHRRFNVLVCTTIIETGIDVPSANTIIINRADKFGLAQLYQLRGRVGRSHHRAYAYLVVPARRAMTRDAQRRLEAIEALEDLGIGFTLASHDLEIRGAGEILGDEQSGQIQEIGFGLYMELLERAVGALKSGKQPQLERPLDHGTEINLHIPALIPADYLPDVHTRLIMYKRIAGAADEEELQSLQEEMIDRFGLHPEPVKNLFQITGLKRRAMQLGIRKIDLGAQGGRIHFHEQADIDPAHVIELIQSAPQHYRLDGQDRLKITRELPDTAAKYHILSELFDSFSAREDAA